MSPGTPLVIFGIFLSLFGAVTAWMGMELDKKPTEMSTTWKGPIQLDCDLCRRRDDVPSLHVEVHSGESVRHAIEAAAEVEHFMRTGCRGKITMRGELPPELLEAGASR